MTTAHNSFVFGLRYISKAPETISIGPENIKQETTTQTHTESERILI